LKAAFKVKYFFLGAIAIAPIGHLIHSFLTPSKIRILLISLVGTMTVTTLYGLFVILSQNDFLNLHETLFPGRNLGFTSYMRHAHSSLYTTVLLLWGLVHTGEKLANIRTFLFIGIIVGIVGTISSGTRGAVGALLISFPLIWGHRRCTDRRVSFTRCLVGCQFTVFNRQGDIRANRS
jgi:hypothetical protein